MNKKILLVGGGGHCKSVLDSLLNIEEYDEIAIVDVKENIGSNILGKPIVGCDDDLPQLFQEGYNYAFVTVGSIGNPTLRIKLFNLIQQIGFTIPTIIDPSAVVSKHVLLNQGIYIGKGATINAGVVIEKGVIVNTKTLIEHDCHLYEFAHIAPGSILCGHVEVGAHVHIGAGAMVKQQVKIGDSSIIGMGSVVLKDISSNKVAYGNPCREVNSK